MAVSNGHGIEGFILDQRIERKTFPAIAFGVNAGIEQQPVVFQFHEPRARANGRVRVQINYPHGSF
jgi:hypothetical protein